MTRSSSVRAGLAQRARIVLLAADGVSNTAIAERVGVSRPTVLAGGIGISPAGSRDWAMKTAPAARGPWITARW